MGACLSKGEKIASTSPLQSTAARGYVPATTKSASGNPIPGAKKAAEEGTNLHIQDANHQPPQPAAEIREPPSAASKQQEELTNGEQTVPHPVTNKISSVSAPPTVVQIPETALPPVTSTPLSPSSSPFAAAASSRLTAEEGEPPHTNGVSNEESLESGWEGCSWSDTVNPDDCSEGETYSTVYPLDPGAERKRVHALKRLGIHYTSNEPSLDFITKLVTNVCSCASAVITFLDTDHCYIKSSTGLPKDMKCVRRSISMCQWVLAPLNPEVLVVQDLTQDDRFNKHPFVVKKPFLRFLAAAPLLDASGQRVGSLTVHDFKPKKFDAEQCNVLCNFAEMSVREIQRITESNMQRAMSLNPTPENEQLLRSIDDCSDGVVLLDVRIARWPVLFSNEGWTQLTGEGPVSGSLKNFWDSFRVPGVSASRNPWQVYDAAIERGETFQVDVILAGSSGKQLFHITFKPATETLDDGMVNINVPAQAATAVPASRTHKLFYFGTILRKAKSENHTSSSGRTNSVPEEEKDDLKPPIPGVRLGPLLGKGSFGSVHYGTWNGAQIAVKVIQHMATEAERQARDEQLEAILGLKMLHPNIVRTFQFATKDRTSRPISSSERLRMEMNGSKEDDSSGPPRGQRRMMETWIVLELCNRGSLQDAIDKGAFKTRGTSLEGQPNMINILRTATEIAGAMTYLHSLDILHSDLNGNNILLISNTGIDDRPFSVKVSDFGLSRIHIGERTIATQTYGTVTHMPPELLSEGRLSKAADVYAFGVLLWEMLTGQRPWAGLRHVQIITHKMRSGSQLKWPSDTHPDFKFNVQRLALRCMSTDPHQRPTFGEVLDCLEPLRDLAERGELSKATSSYDLGERSDLSLLDSVRETEEEGEDKRTSK